ncbi:hypothetical protein L3X38_007027 [Prunus dulcis]|uniref:Uncharacterized protein n=1 Tax=Prunus dulcis TaxID=3755 RepID=A0AAD4ZU20_PRUDU|nr:hypothetical protein L3X38_007027 [Prunus dulcis]
MDKPHQTRDSRGGKTGQDQSLSILPRHPPNIKVSPSLPPSRGPTRFLNVEASRNATWCGQHKLWAARAGIIGCASRFLIPTGRRTCILIRCVYSILIFSGLKSQPMKITLAHWIFTVVPFLN